MAHFWQGLRSGEWLTPERVRGYSLILLGVCVLAVAGWLVLSDGLIDRNGKPLGTDFSSFYAAGSLVLDGRAADVYNRAAHYAREQQLFGAATPYYGWLYPPIFLLLATPLALLRYPLALAVWQVSSFALYLAVIGVIVGRMRRRGIAIGRIMAAGRRRFSRGLDQSGARPERFSHGRAVWRSAAGVARPPAARRHSVWSARL